MPKKERRYVIAKRFTDTDIWKTQRWFRKLPPLDKLVFCYIKDQCNHAGIWKIDCSDLIEDLGLEMFSLEKFIAAVNTEYDKISGEKITKERMLIVGKNHLWITGFIQFQYENKGGTVSPEAAPVKSGLEILEGFGILQQGLDKGYLVLSQPLKNGSVRAKDKDIDKDKDIVKKEKKENSKKVDFSLSKIYDTPYTDYKVHFNGKSVSEEVFNEWKEFVDFILANNFEDVFQTIFVNPQNFGVLKTKNGFSKDDWDPVLRKLLSTGIKPEHNLFFRIPDFMNYVKKEKNGSANKGKDRDSGKEIKFD